MMACWSTWEVRAYLSSGAQLPFLLTAILTSAPEQSWCPQARSQSWSCSTCHHMARSAVVEGRQEHLCCAGTCMWPCPYGCAVCSVSQAQAQAEETRTRGCAVQTAVCSLQWAFRACSRAPFASESITHAGCCAALLKLLMPQGGHACSNAYRKVCATLR